MTTVSKENKKFAARARRLQKRMDALMAEVIELGRDLTNEGHLEFGYQAKSIAEAFAFKNLKGIFDLEKFASYEERELEHQRLCHLEILYSARGDHAISRAYLSRHDPEGLAIVDRLVSLCAAGDHQSAVVLRDSSISKIGYLVIHAA